MNHEILRMGAGIAGGLIALMLYISPVSTFTGIVKKKTTDGFSAVPYAISLFNCLIYVWYSSPSVSEGWSNLVVLVVNAIGLLFNLAFVIIYLVYGMPSSKIAMQRLLAAVVTIFATVLVISVVVMHDHKQRKFLVGTTGMIATMSLYASPLSVLKTVLQTKSVEFMPVSLSFFTTLCSAFWLAYGALSKDLVIMLPNFLGISLGCVQMVLYFFYKRKNKSMELPKHAKEVANDEGDPESPKIIKTIEVSEPLKDKAKVMT